MTCKNHPEYKLPDDPHAKVRYASAMRHVEAAKKAGKSVEEIHALFKKIMAFDPIRDFDSIPNDEAHKKYRSAVLHAKKAMEAGKSSAEVHEIFNKVLHSTGEGKCSAAHKKA